MSQPCRIYTIKLVFVKKPHFIADILMLAFTEPPFRGRESRHAMALMGRKCVFINMDIMDIYCLNLAVKHANF